LLDAMLPGMRGVELAERIRADARLRETPLILLSSAGQASDEGRARTLGIARILTKPARPSKLLHAIMQAVRADETPAPVPTSATSGVEPRRILVAEDDPVNQRVIVEMLRNRGHEVAVAHTGRQALEQMLADAAEFDLVLMDVRMPEMSGLEATRRLRAVEREGLGPRPHLPVVAMTAHAMAGDREACLEAGMDDYLAKPVRAKLLFAMVEKFPVVHRARSGPAATGENTEPRRTGTS
jgi:CheY-like chemotaxis protein